MEYVLVSKKGNRISINDFLVVGSVAMCNYSANCFKYFSIYVTLKTIYLVKRKEFYSLLNLTKKNNYEKPFC